MTFAASTLHSLEHFWLLFEHTDVCGRFLSPDAGAFCRAGVESPADQTETANDVINVIVFIMGQRRVTTAMRLYHYKFSAENFFFDKRYQNICARIQIILDKSIVVG